MNKYSSHQFIDMFQAINPIGVTLFIVGVICVAVAIAYTIRLWLVQTATFQIQKDLADIKTHLIGSVSEDAVVVPLAVIESTDVQAPITPNKLSIKKPRKVFMWIAITIPVLIIVFVITIFINKSS